MMPDEDFRRMPQPPVILAEGISFFKAIIGDRSVEGEEKIEYFGLSLSLGPVQIRIACRIELFADFMEEVVKHIRTGKQMDNQSEVSQKFANGCNEFFTRAVHADHIDVRPEKMN